MLYPLMLFGLLSLSIPIAIHLIQRQRLKPTPLATMGFLDREDVANAFAPTPRDVLQLLLRLLLLSLLVLLMARIVIPAGGGPRTSVVILDQSLSMQQQVLGDRSSFELHKQRIQELIENKRPEDRIALRLVGDTVTERTGFLKDPEALTQVLDGFTLSESGGLGVMPAVREAVQRLRSRREANPAVLVFSDHQSGNYAESPLNEQQWAQLNRDLAQAGVTLVLAQGPKPGEEAYNLAVESATLSPMRVHVGSSARVTATVRSFAEDEQPVSLVVHEGQRAG